MSPVEFEQMSLPGIEPGYNRPLSELERSKSIELSDRCEYDRKNNDNTWDVEEGTIPLAESNPEFSSYDPWQ